jgi:very-short-patch-repair endonuclease
MNYRGGNRETTLIHLARENRQHASRAEAILWSELRGKRFLGLKWRRQHQVLNFILDFYCHELRLGIEIDGSSHDTEFAIAADAARARKIGMSGVTVVRFTNREVMDELGRVLTYLAKMVEKRRGL